jgi:AsmA protein
VFCAFAEVFMKKNKLLFTVLVIAVLLMLTSLGLYFLVDLNSHKPSIESALSNALGLHVRIKGNIGVLLFPDLHISMGDINISGRESDIASLEKIAFGLKIIPLLKGRVIIDEITLRKPEISLVRLKNGEFNVTQKTPQTTEQKENHIPPFAVNNISLSDGDIVYSDHKNGSVTNLNGVDIAIKKLLVADKKKQSLIHGLSFKGTLDSKKITFQDVELSDLTFQIHAKEGLYNIRELSSKLFSGKGKGEVTFDVSGKTPSLNIQSMLSQFRLEEFLHLLSEKETMAGYVDLSLNVSMQGKGMDEMKKTMKGHISLRGENLVLKNYDIDRILNSYKDTQSIGALDIGAFFLAGPVGTAVTKGYHYEKLYRQTGTGEGMMTKFFSDWNIENGVAIAEDVAIATRRNRLAVKGKLDLVKEKYEDVIVALINERGCAALTQKIYGSLNNPQFQKTTVLQSAVGSVLSLIGKGGKFLPGAQCEAFYTGSVDHPK